jgi:hypothetical protein
MVSKFRNLFILLIMSVSFLTACGPGQLFGPTITPSPTLTLTSTSTPTFTPSPTATLTPTYTKTLVPSKTSTETQSVPSDPPLSEFHHIPIMPGAVAGEFIGEDFWYHYIIKVSQEKVRDFYIKQLPLHNWAIHVILPNDKGGYIIYRERNFDFIYIYQVGDTTDILIMLSPNSPSRD